MRRDEVGEGGEGGSSEAEVSLRCRYIGFLIPSFIDFEEHHQVAYSGDNTTASFGGECLAKKAQSTQQNPSQQECALQPSTRRQSVICEFGLEMNHCLFSNGPALNTISIRNKIYPALLQCCTPHDSNNQFVQMVSKLTGYFCFGFTPSPPPPSPHLSIT